MYSRYFSELPVNLEAVERLTLGTFRDGISESLQKREGEPAPPRVAGG